MICRISSSFYFTSLLISFFTTVVLITLLASLETTEAIFVGEPNLSPKNPFGGGPPEIIMTLDGKTYPGELRNFIWNSGDVNDNLPAIEPTRSNITAIVPNNTVTIEKGSQVKFAIKDNPAPEVQPDSLSVTAYTLNGNPYKVIDVSNNKTDTFDVDLNEGKYILLAVATWLPNEGTYQTIEGIVSRTYSINVTDK